jgi:hypothetical protein
MRGSKKKLKNAENENTIALYTKKSITDTYHTATHTQTDTSTKSWRRYSDQ